MRSKGRRSHGRAKTGAGRGAVALTLAYMLPRVRGKPDDTQNSTVKTLSEMTPEEKAEVEARYNAKIKD
jgi:hypothetical protein